MRLPAVAIAALFACGVVLGQATVVNTSRSLAHLSSGWFWFRGVAYRQRNCLGQNSAISSLLPFSPH